MNAPITPSAFAETAAPRVDLLPHELPQAIDWFPQARVLSLDCFDTLIWRDTHAPVDVFTTLPDITPMQRRQAEMTARKVAGFAHNRNEVTIGEIYAQLMPRAAQAQRDAAIAAELEAEAQACFAFAPTVELMRRAKARGLQVIIVSDTYLDAAQLRELIERAAGADVAGLIDRIFVSSAYGQPKALGLYAQVLRKLSAKPHEILHIGDNHGADVVGVSAHGVSTLHLKQFTPALEQQLRLEAGIGAMIHPVSKAVTAAQPHRAALAAALPLQQDAATRLGMAVMGPILTGFDIWLRHEAEALSAKHGGRVHYLFLMRDGWLPMRVHAARGDAATAGFTTHPIEISRFTATASSFTDERDVARYADENAGTEAGPMARQLLLSAQDIAKICDKPTPENACYALLQEMRKTPRKRATVAASRAFAKRLVAHVRAVADPAPGDTLMLVDLGYNGTVQNRIDTVLAQALNVHVAGRYLLLREADKPGLDKRGFLDIGHYDDFALNALTANVAVLEQLCTTGMGSVIDYSESGDPIRRANAIAPEQAAIRHAVQEGTIAFAHALQDVTVRGDHGRDPVDLWRQAVTSVMARLMFMPLGHELAVIERFEHDVNLGTDEHRALFDLSVARTGLRQQGLFYLNSSDRMYLPAELKGQGLAPRLTVLAMRRFGLPFTFADFTDKTVELPVIFADSQSGGVFEQTIAASATHDGFYVAAIPMGEARYGVALRLGAKFEWVEIDSIRIMPQADFLSEGAPSTEQHITPEPLLEGVERITPRLLRCHNEAGFLMVNPPQQVARREPLILTVAFRPLTDD
ncbi:HAD family hydrolase [Novosphingobium rosa]|uniref:HAD family hydrolase n=1 Tax=Novosphingobium rosa TaxID=76978 RepID=UPI00082AC190|nr:HAD family hydrolase [Novosphingobium rosa]